MVEQGADGWGGGAALGSGEEVPGRAEELTAELDPRLADVWGFLFASDLGPEELAEHIGWFLRMAYLSGYQDGVCEPERGLLFRRLRVPVPPRRAGHGPSRGRSQ